MSELDRLKRNVKRELRRGEKAVRRAWDSGADLVYGGPAAWFINRGQDIKEKLGFDPPPLAPEAYESQNPYEAGVNFGPEGFPEGPMPRGQWALDYQYLANQEAERRRNALWGDAHQAMRAGTDLFQSYRPGGSAALAAGLYQGQASLYAGQAGSIEAPDLLMGYRERKQQEADAERKQAERFNRTLGILQLGAGLIGAASGNPTAGLGAAVGLGGLAQQTGGGGQIAPPGGQSAQMGAQGSYGTMMGPGWGNPGGGGPGLVGGPNPPLVGQAQMAPGGGGVQGSYGGAGAPPPAGGGDGASAGSRVTAPPGGGAGGAGGGPGVDTPGGGGFQAGQGQGQMMPVQIEGDAPMAMFTPEEAARNAAMSTPASTAMAVQEWADDDFRRSSVGWFALSGRQRLLKAMAMDRVNRTLGRFRPEQWAGSGR